MIGVRIVTFFEADNRSVVISYLLDTAANYSLQLLTCKI